VLRQKQKPENKSVFGVYLQLCAFSHNMFIHRENKHTFFYPDYTVGPGISPDHADYTTSSCAPLVGCTTDRELLLDGFSSSYPSLTLPRRLPAIQVLAAGWNI
jgi:hypothetical protein